MAINRFTRNGLYLSAYAPGDGAIAFSWIDPETNHVVSSIITPHLIRAFQKHNTGKHLENWQIRTLNGQLRLVHPITRVDDHTLIVHGGYHIEPDRTVNYSINPNPPDQLHYNDINVTTTIVVDETLVINDHPVKHISTVTAICFFLNHEKDFPQEA